MLIKSAYVCNFDKLFIVGCLFGLVLHMKKISVV